jgi:eukaryotic-like serine/threonine-protein kinase
MSSMDPEAWRRISEHIDRVLELPEPERAAYLAGLGRDDPAVAMQVNRLLAVREQAGFHGFLSGTGSLAPDLAAAASPVGSRLGPYVIEAEIGRGGMGTVWRARRADGRFEGCVAVKLLNAALVGRPAEQRFVREGHVLANLQHPHIAHLVDAGVASSGQAYLVLEYVEGVRIDQYCEANRLTSKERIRLFLDVLGAVAHAHSNLVVHRDIKPSNILVTDDGRVKLLDFGIAGLLAAEGEGAATPLTLEAGSAFTPEYAAPEQLLNRPMTTATDVYALGLVLFVLLAGRHPHADGGDSAVERLRTIVDQDAPLLSQTADDTMSARTLRGDLDNIVAKALKRAPTDRYPTVDAFADDLRRFLANEPVRARPDSLAYRASKFAARHRGGVVTATLTALGLIGLSAFAWLQMREAQMQRDEAERQRKSAQAEAGFVTLMLGSIGAGDRPLTVTDILDHGLVLLDRQFGSDRPFVVRTLINMSGRYMDVGDTAKEYTALTTAEKIARETADPELLAAVQCNTVETEIAAGRLEQAATRLREGKQALARVYRPRTNDVVDCVHAEASLADATGDRSRATGLVLRAIAMLESAGAEDTRTIQYAGLLSHAAVLYGNEGNDAASLEYALKNLRTLEQLGRGDTQSAVGARHNVAVSLKRLGEVREALAQERALISRLQSADPNAVIAAPVTGTYGELLGRMGEARAALSWLDRAVHDARASGNPNVEFWSRVKRARVLVELGRLPEAAADLDEIERGVAGRETLFRDVLQAATITRAEYLLARGLDAQAQAAIGPLVDAIPQPLRGDTSPLAGRTLATASRIALAANRLADAERLADEAAEVGRLRARKPELSADAGESYLLKAEALRKQGALAESRKAARAAVEPLTNGLGPSHPMTLAAAALAQGG